MVKFIIFLSFYRLSFTERRMPIIVGLVCSKNMRGTSETKYYARSPFSLPFIWRKFYHAWSYFFFEEFVWKSFMTSVLFMMWSENILEQEIHNYSTFSSIPRDISQQILNELVYSQRLTDASFKAFQCCSLQVNHFKLQNRLKLILC